MEHEDPATMLLFAEAAEKDPLRHTALNKRQDDLLLEKAVDLAKRLTGAFETHSGLPISNINLKTRKGSADKGNNGLVSTAEVGTLQLEFRRVVFSNSGGLRGIDVAPQISFSRPFVSTYGVPKDFEVEVERWFNGDGCAFLFNG